MDLSTGEYYHFYNRTNAYQRLFRSHDNYQYFARKYTKMIGHQVETIAYCLMPTHFHFLIRVQTEDVEKMKHDIGRMQSSYTHAINKRYHRHGSLFQNHAKTKLVADDDYFQRLLWYIHRNPVAAGYVHRVGDWPFSSYRDLIFDNPLALIPVNFREELYGTRSDFISRMESDVPPEPGFGFF